MISKTYATRDVGQAEATEACLLVAATTGAVAMTLTTALEMVIVDVVGLEEAMVATTATTATAITLLAMEEDTMVRLLAGFHLLLAHQALALVYRLRPLRRIRMAMEVATAATMVAEAISRAMEMEEVVVMAHRLRPSREGRTTAVAEVATRARDIVNRLLPVVTIASTMVDTAAAEDRVGEDMEMVEAMTVAIVAEICGEDVCVV